MLALVLALVLDGRSRTQALPWDSVLWLAEVDDPAEDRPVALCHYPMMTWNYARNGALHRLCCWPGCPLATASQRAKVMFVESITERESIYVRGSHCRD